MAAVTLENVSKTYSPDIVALNALSLEIHDREFMVVTGPSGCGKTTLLRVIAGLEQPDEGLLFIGGREVNRLQPKDRDVAMVFQNYALYPHMTVYQNIAFALVQKRLSKSEIRQRVGEMANLLGITSVLKRKPRSLSGGQRQRVALGRAMVCRPQVFLFDEPLSNLDMERRYTMRAEIKSLVSKLETTILYVTHDQEEAMSLADRICVIDQGVIQQVGSPDELS
ncbi:ABC transporter ATP-binding protein [Planctomycetota bacterium]